MAAITNLHFYTALEVSPTDHDDLSLKARMTFSQPDVDDLKNIY